MSLVMPDDGLVIVTGASAGLGRAMAVEFSREGFAVAGIARAPDGLEETRAACKGNRFTPVPFDLSRIHEIAALVDRLRDTHGQIAILVNNAAVYPRRDFLNESAASFEATMAINALAPMALSRAVLTGMTETGRGRILNVTSFAEVDPAPCSSAYAVSKGALRILTRTMIADLGDRFPGIVIGNWMPGELATGMGLLDGLPPETSAAWGVALARRRDPSYNGATFERDTELSSRQRITRRLRDVIASRIGKPRRL